MSRAFAAFGIGLATFCGVLISYSTFRPALEEQQAERLGVVREHRPNEDTIISDAIRSDLQEAKSEINKSGFAWGIRAVLAGKNPYEQQRTQQQQQQQQAQQLKPRMSPAEQKAQAVEKTEPKSGS